MSSLQKVLALIAIGASLAALLSPLAMIGETTVSTLSHPIAMTFALAGLATIIRFKLKFSIAFDGIMSVLGIWGIMVILNGIDKASFGFWMLLVAAWAFGWLYIERLSNVTGLNVFLTRLIGLITPVFFGIWILVLWEAITRGANVPFVLLPPPSMVWVKITTSLSILWADFQQTILKAVLSGYVMGCGSAFLAAIAIDRSPFLQRGLLPVGNFVAALPIVGMAPIMVMWFGFDWESKAAVIVIMTFFPMLVNTLTGLTVATNMQQDLMRTYAAGYWQTLFKLRLPVAAPFIFNALKINSTLALIGGIVAEFFGTPTVGMGFRISTEVGRMNIDMVWAEIAMAALAGSTFYGIIALTERAVTFWHPSIRAG
ncbi:MAG: ABC transporter permease [Rhizobiaceae bacterium]|nr:ABC transporter permease [Rhizobiaceae bacterium]MBL4696770.1 ABC transporter permease [Rhizobiaceae bacterium]